MTQQLYDDIRDAIGNFSPDSQQEISLKIKPAAANNSLAGAPSSTAAPQVGGGGGSGAATPATPSVMGDNGSSVVPSNQRLSRNPQLPQTPSGSYTDAEYEAALASARHSFQNNYLNVLQQLGFVDDSGKFIPGLVETAAARRRAQLNSDLNAATEQVNADSRRGGTTFSGRRAYRLSEAQRPFNTELAQLESDTPLQLSNLYEQATGLITDFQLQMQQLLADAAGRKATALQQQAAVAPPEAAAPPPPPAPAGPVGTFTPSAVATYDPTGILGLSQADTLGSLAADRLFGGRLARIGI